MKPLPQYFQEIMEDEKRRNFLFKFIWMSSLFMLVLGYVIIVALLL